MAAQRLEYIQKFLTTLYTDDDFLNDFLRCCSDPDENDGLKLLNEKGFAFQSGDIDLVDQLRAPTRDLLVLRLAGGAYRFRTNDAGFWELMVDSKEKLIYIDSKPVENTNVDKDGNVSFTHSDYTFQLQFQYPWIVGEKQPDRLGFSGKISKGAAATAQAIEGHRFFPFGNAFDSNPPRNPDMPYSQTAPEDVMEMVDDFREDLANKSLAVVIDLIDTRCQPDSQPQFVEIIKWQWRKPKGDEMLGGASVGLTALGFALRSIDYLGKGWDNLFGGAIGALGGALSQSVRSRWVEDDKRRMTNKVLCYKLEGLQTHLDTAAKQLVNGVPDTQLRNTEYIKQLRVQFRNDHYIPWAKGLMNDFIYNKYWLMHRFWKNEFLEGYKEALESRFDKHMPEASLNALFDSLLKQRWAEEVAPQKLEKLAQNLESREDEYKRNAAEIDKRDGLSDEARAKEKAKIKNKFEKDKEEIEKERSSIDKDTNDIKERVAKNEAEQLRKSIEQDTEKARQTEENRVKEEKERRR
ncbi:uncharacterized protein Aud_000006 [Aspergillus udagawae]|uniref:Uncharacterized protein n=1 Tax=Aspergillus udagawae TaxID=91492 RepID=A0A8E0USG3_9EURO|nr:uncharacterized protein Aud_000006 [Aspergillus udagawae]GIC84192.1 hypothetical protein Aud_000006 [Aspergillus udagawae]